MNLTSLRSLILALVLVTASSALGQQAQAKSKNTDHALRRIESIARKIQRGDGSPKTLEALKGAVDALRQARRHERRELARTRTENERLRRSMKSADDRVKAAAKAYRSMTSKANDAARKRVAAAAKAYRGYARSAREAAQKRVEAAYRSANARSAKVEERSRRVAKAAEAKARKVAPRRVQKRSAPSGEAASLRAQLMAIKAEIRALRALLKRAQRGRPDRVLPPAVSR